MLHASHIKKLQLNFQSFLLNFKIYNSIKKKKKQLFSKKIQISFILWLEKYKYVSKEDTNQFYILKKFRSASKEDTDLFLCFEKNSDLHLRKIQICFCV